MTNRYLLFAFDVYSSFGGMLDCKLCTSDFKSLTLAAKKLAKEYDCVQYFDYELSSTFERNSVTHVWSATQRQYIGGEVSHA